MLLPFGEPAAIHNCTTSGAYGSAPGLGGLPLLAA